MGEGNSLSLEKPASCSVVEVKSTTPKNSWTSPENQHHPLAQIFTVYKTSVNSSKQDKGNLENLNDSKMADNNNILDDIWGQ